MEPNWIIATMFILLVVGMLMLLSYQAGLRIGRSEGGTDHLPHDRPEYSGAMRFPTNDPWKEKA